MLTKILFTLAVITGCFWFASAKRRRQSQPILVVASKKDLRKREILRRSAYLFMGVMVLAAIIATYIQISDNNTILTVNVINSETGTRVVYQARRQDIKSSSFTTLEGSTIYVANIERIEVDSR